MDFTELVTGKSGEDRKLIEALFQCTMSLEAQWFRISDLIKSQTSEEIVRELVKALNQNVDCQVHLRDAIMIIDPTRRTQSVVRDL